jgi:spoIIIJ-associated protein
MTTTDSVSSVTIQGKSLEQALVKAAGSLGITQDEMAHKVLKDDTSKGIFSIFKTSTVEIEAWTKSSKDCCAKPSRSKKRTRTNTRTPNTEPRKELTSEQHSALIEELRDFCEGICSQITGESVTVSASEDNGRLILNIDDEAMATHISKNTKLAEAMEHILRKKPRHLRQELPFRIFVDVNGVRRDREKELVSMAEDLSTKVCEDLNPIVLNYKSSYDRKIIHMALDADDRVYTKSIGSGPNRKLMILPVKGDEAAPEA